MRIAYPCQQAVNRGRGVWRRPRTGIRIGMADVDTPGAEIKRTLRRASGALQRAGVPFMLGGSLAFWARGAPPSRNDVDLLVPEQHADRAVAVLAAEGMEVARVPEDWLRKVWDGPVMVDLITAVLGEGAITEAAVEAAERIQVAGITMPVASLESVLTSKLLSLDPQQLDFGPPLALSRALREQIDWAAVAEATASSPYARAFLVLVRELGVVTSEVEVLDG